MQGAYLHVDRNEPYMLGDTCKNKKLRIFRSLFSKQQKNSFVFISLQTVFYFRLKVWESYLQPYQPFSAKIMSKTHLRAVCGFTYVKI